MNDGTGPAPEAPDRPRRSDPEGRKRDMAATKGPTGQELEQRLQELLGQGAFEPPESFKEQANLTDPGIYEEADGDWQGWWLGQAKELQWEQEPEQSLDDSNAPFYKWFADGKLNASVQCVDRHVEAGNGERVAFHWHGEEGETRDITYADLHRDVQKFA